MKVLGITGCTGAGKTELLQHLAQKGFSIMDCDKIYYEMLQTNESLRLHLQDSFGDIFFGDGSLDRKKLAAIVFTDRDKLKLLNMIVYYFMGVEIRCRLKTMREQGTELAAIDAVNLIESGLGELCTTTAAVIARRDIRLSRIMKRDAISAEEGEKRISAQHDEEYYKRHCRIILENNGTTEDFIRQAERALSDFYN